jgi:hypothetical protein
VIDRYSGTDDDAVIMPALATADFIPKPKPIPPPRQHMVQKLFFKQTIIPILLTLGVICLLIPTIGLASGETSPFVALKQPFFLAVFYPLALAFLIFGLITMLQVKKELDANSPAQPASESENPQ